MKETKANREETKHNADTHVERTRTHFNCFCLVLLLEGARKDNVKNKYGRKRGEDSKKTEQLVSEPGYCVACSFNKTKYEIRCNPFRRQPR
jgi:hypothetical protein